MAKADKAYRIDVNAGEQPYPVFIGEGLLADGAWIRSQLLNPRVLIVTNDKVAPLYLPQLLEHLSGLDCDYLILPDGEQYKNNESLQKIYDKLIRAHYHRDNYLIALGGGVIGDITGFAASTYQRGMPYLQIPTSLLAQVDASVGGKTAINHPMGKNLIGSFYQPKAVIIDVNSLSTLPDREFNAGLAEIIKYALLQGKPFFEKLYTALREGLKAGNKAQLMPLIAECCRIKAAIVAQDEKETGLRALLNLGHTFAHALEAETAYQQFLHGEAVAIGLYCAVSLSVRLNYADKSIRSQLEAMLTQAGLPKRIPTGIDVNRLYDKMFLDKKIKDNRLQFVLIEKPGACFLHSEVPESLLKRTLIEASEGEQHE